MIKLVIFDVDGVFTDGKIYVSADGQQMKNYNGKDSYALKLLRNHGIKTGVVTAHAGILKHMEHIYPRLDYCAEGRYEKVTPIADWIAELDIGWSEVAYIGDDLPDLGPIERVGFSASPSDAIPEVLEKVDYVCRRRGGDGAVREFVSEMFSRNILADQSNGE